MKNKGFILCVFLLCISVACRLAYAESEYTVSADTAVAGQDYILIIQNGERNIIELRDDDDSIRYIEQKTATGSSISFTNVKPAGFDKATAFIISEKGVLVKSVVLEDVPLDILTLPSGIINIDYEAFEGIAATVIKLPDGIKTIGKRAFANCKGLRRIYIPASVSTIEEDAFENTPNVVIYGIDGSAAERFAKQHDITFSKGDP